METWAVLLLVGYGCFGAGVNVGLIRASGLGCPLSDWRVPLLFLLGVVLWPLVVLDREIWA